MKPAMKCNNVCSREMLSCLERSIRMLVPHLRDVLAGLCSKLQLQRDFTHVMELYDKGAYDKAYRAFCDVIKNEPRWCKVADVYIKWADLELLANNNPVRALELLDKAKELGCSLMAYYYMKRAEALWLIEEYQKALHCYEKSVEEDPCAFYRSNLARALSLLEDDRALDVWQEVLEEEPENCLAHTYIGLETIKSGDRDKAMIMAKEADRLASSARDILEVARLYYEMGDFKTVIDKYLEAMKQGNDRGQICAGIAHCYLLMGEVNQAKKYLKRALKYSPENEYVKEIRRDYEEKLTK